MPKQTFTVVALPYSRAEGVPFHVSLFVSPDLVPDGAEAPLNAFEVWVKWTANLAGARITLLNQSGQIVATPDLNPLDQAAWSAIFPSDLPVRARSAPDWDDRHWRTFRAAEVHDVAKVFSLFSMATSPTSLPIPDAETDVVSRIMLALTANSDQRNYDESFFTEQWDRSVFEPHASDKVSLDHIEKRIGAARGLERAFMELHRARRFYERPEGQVAYERRPIEGTPVPVLAPLKPDFHERVSLLSDHPGILRKLGLVIDLRVDDLTALSKSGFLKATIEFDTGLVSQSPETSVQVVGEDMVVPSKAADFSAGRLRLGDEALFSVLDMDADGAALKTDRFLWTVPRLVDVAKSTADASTATPAHRTGGFTIARALRAQATQGRMSGQRVIGSELASGKAVRLGAEDVVQGLRLDVWDDTTKEWYSLHRRRVDAEVLGHGLILDDVVDEGFTQGSAATETAGVEDSPVHIHEAIASWGGWSLSAVRPGKRVRHENGDEIVEDTTVDPNPSTPVVLRSVPEPGSLPVLRYGRSYAFRAWGVDLAGNSRGRALGPVPPVAPRIIAQVSAALPATRIPQLAGPDVAVAVRSEASAVVVHRRQLEAQGPPTVDPGIPLKVADLDPAVLSRLRRRRSLASTRMGLASPLATVGRAALVQRQFGDLVLDTDRLPFAQVGHLDPGVIAGGMGLGDSAADGVDTITPLRPFLRWEPVQPPTVVPRHGNSPGESLLQLVIRSGVTQDLETLELAVVSPEDYADANPGHRYRATSERHLAPPKTSQSEAELHGQFDFAIGSTDPADHAAALGMIVRESGTLFDMDVPRLDDPNTRDPQPGIQLVKDPGTPDSTLKSLPIPTGEMPASGQYVVHDVDELTLPYLPDPLGQGISLVFPDAGRDRLLQFPFGTEGFTARYGGTWPALEPFRLVLAPSEELTGEVDGRTLTIALPPGDIQRFRLSSSLGRDDLEKFGFWQLLPPSFRGNHEVTESAADGWLWVFTPFDEVTLVHAVPRPLEAPRPTVLRPVRLKGSTDSGLSGAIDIHGPSTEQLTAEAAWTEYTDDLSVPGPDVAENNGIGFITTVRPEEDLAVLFGGIPSDFEFPVPGFGPVWFHRAVHQWGDTKHRRVTYRFRAATRFREYFDPTSLVAAPIPAGVDPSTLPADDGQSVVGPAVEVSIPSSANPVAPIVHSVLPLFRWETGTEPEQPVGVRRSRRAGIRIYLERPWYSSGEGELLAVLLAPAGNDVGLENVVSQWGTDPVWRSSSILQRGMLLELDSLLHSAGLDDRPGDARPVTLPATLNYVGVKGSPRVTVVGYAPEYNAERGLWYVDIAIDPGDRIWPFVRLSIARYQPESLTGCELSQPVKCDFQQLLPERTASVSRTDVRHARVVVSGPIGTGRGAPDKAFPPAAVTRHATVRHNRIMVARLQRADVNIPTDLGWDTVDTVELIVRGTGRTAAEAAWVGELTAPEDIPLARPGSNPDWRVSIEEWELLPGDPDPNGPPTIVPLPTVRRRLVYAEALNL